jgi:hypothetical protein
MSSAKVSMAKDGNEVDDADFLLITAAMFVA